MLPQALAKSYEQAATDANKVYSAKEVAEKGAANSLIELNDNDVKVVDFDSKMEEHLMNVKRAQQDADAEALREHEQREQAVKDAKAQEAAETAEVARLKAEASEAQRAADEARQKEEMEARLEAARQRQIKMSSEHLYPWLRGTHQGSTA